MYVDLDDSKYSDNSTVPPMFVVTSQRPDIVIIEKDTNKINIFELTCPFEMNIDSAHNLKTDKYGPLKDDIMENSYKVDFEAFEVGSRGFITPDNKKRLKKIHHFCKKGIKFKVFYDNISALAVSCSYFIFLSRNDMAWSNPPLLNAEFKY